MAHTWELECLLCGATPDSPMVNQKERHVYGDLVAMQKHGIVFHDLTQEDFIKTERIPPLSEGMEHKSYKWRLPSGQLYLRATRREATPMG